MDGESVRRQREARDWSQQGLINRIQSRGHKRPLGIRGLKYIESKGKDARLTARVESQLADVFACFTGNSLPQSDNFAPKSAA